MNLLKAQDLKRKIEKLEFAMKTAVEEMPNGINKQVVIFSSSLSKKDIIKLVEISEDFKLFIQSDSDFPEFLQVTII